MAQHLVTTRDIYESAYFLTQGAHILNIEVLRENRKFVCTFTFVGERILAAQHDYYNATAAVNLWEFRRCFTRINALIGTARREYREEYQDAPKREVIR